MRHSTSTTNPQIFTFRSFFSFPLIQKVWHIEFHVGQKSRLLFRQKHRLLANNKPIFLESSKEESYLRINCDRVRLQSSFQSNKSETEKELQAKMSATPTVAIVETGESRLSLRKSGAFPL